MTLSPSSGAVVSETANRLVGARWGRRPTATRSIVHWECQAPEHRALHSRHGNGGLTINEGAWAYCDGAGANDAHHWSATGGVPLESLVRWTAPNGSPVDVRTAVAIPPTSIKTNGDIRSPRKSTGIRRT